MGIQAPAEVKYRLIYDAIRDDDNLLNISMMCKIAGVSRSGFYAWMKSATYRQSCEENDVADFATIKQAYEFRGYAKGARSIYMRLLHMDPPVVMNIKKIRRLMKKYGLFCPIRQANPYRRMAKAMKTSHVAPNVVDRKFGEFPPRRALLTDITYLFYNNGICYLSTILDACTHEILAYKLSENLKVDFVLDTVDELQKRYGAELDSETIVHSDQGCHYTSNAFIEKLHDEEFVQSMSRKGNCWDNAPQESFFGHMKDEIADVISRLESFADVSAKTDDWLDYYNKDRYQWELQKLSPREYYLYRTTGIYPLKTGMSKNPSERGSAPNPEV